MCLGLGLLRIAWALGFLLGYGGGGCDRLPRFFKANKGQPQANQIYQRYYLQNYLLRT
jgi:hypothetical protein